jgi:pyruvate-formate lyase-activating enzyme
MPRHGIEAIVPPDHEDPALHAFLAADPAAQVKWLVERQLPPAVLLPLQNACAQRCFFCTSPGTTGFPAQANTPAAVIQRHLQARPDSVYHLLIGGNEPVLHPLFSDVIHWAKAAGFLDISLMTNGVGLIPHLQTWISLGLREVVVPLYALDAALHDTICGVACFTEVMANLMAAQQAGLRVRVHSLFLNETLHELPQLAETVRQKFGYRLSVGLLRPKPGFNWQASAPSFQKIRQVLHAIPEADRPLLLMAPACLSWGSEDGPLPGVGPAVPESPSLLAQLYFSSQRRSWAPMHIDLHVFLLLQSRQPGV